MPLTSSVCDFTAFHKVILYREDSKCDIRYVKDIRFGHKYNKLCLLSSLLQMWAQGHFVLHVVDIADEK